MNLRSSALIASTLLAGCVFTDDANQTGGDFLQAHGAAVRSADSGVFDLPVTSVEAVPLEGVPGANGTEPVVLGSLGGDSIRLVLGFNLKDKELRDSRFRTQNDSLTRVRFTAYGSTSAMTVRGRFFFLKSAKDTSGLAALFAGVEFDALKADTVAISGLVDTQYVLPALQDDSLLFLDLPGAIAATVRQEMLDTTKTTSATWLVALFDTKAGTDSRAQFASNVAMVGPDTSIAGAHDTTGVLSLGVYQGNAAYRSTGLRSAQAAGGLGLWPSGGNGLRVRFDADQLRAKMRNEFGVEADTSGGYDHTFSVLQARVGIDFSSVTTDNGSYPHGLVISSTVVTDSSPVKENPITTNDATMGLDGIPAAIKAANSWTDAGGVDVKVDPVPGGYFVEILVEKIAISLPTRYSLARGSYSGATLTKFFMPFNEKIEFRVSSNLRVRIWSARGAANTVYAKWWAIEGVPSSDYQGRDDDSLRTEALVWKGRTFVEQEARTPLTQLLNRKQTVEWTLAPRASSDLTSRLVAVPTDAAKVFKSMEVLVRPTVGRSN